MNASDIMTTEVVSVGPDTPLSDVIKTLLDNRISAVPVVEGGTIIGIISEGDLLRRTEIGTEHKWSRWLELATSSDDLAADYVKTHGRSARDVMIQPVITVRVDTPITEIADLLESRMIKRVFVVRDGQLVGIVSRANLIQAVASSKTPAIESSLTNDRQIRDTLLNELRRYRWAAWPTEANIIVNNGEVHLWGRIRSEEERKAMLVAARNTPGVCGVEDHMEYPQSYLVF